MDNLIRFEQPTVTEADATWSCTILGLPTNAFVGQNGNDPRMDVLKSGITLDVESCPGSGKTTLLVAKLAILAHKWSDPRRGLCVLSHTNAARREIENRLGNVAEGKRLLSYPHFIGTIHGFVNEFLAIPWLRSLGYPINVIDDLHCEQHRRRLLRLPQFSALSNYVNPREASGKLNVVTNWCVVSPACDILKENGEPEFKVTTGTAARQLAALGAKCVRDGYYRYGEMFMWANDLIAHVPDVRNAIRERFPLLFIDEVQDNSERQSALLFRLFMEGDAPVVRQRFGDANQAIYHNVHVNEGATTDRFPREGIRKDIPNSYRFGQQIADLANPFALEPQNLLGTGPSGHEINTNALGKHAIFLFNNETIPQVLSVYASYLMGIFSDEELRHGTFTAVGSVHRPPNGDDNMPRSVGQYWPEYDYELTATEPKPQTLFQYFMAGRKITRQTGEAHHVVEKVAEGLLRLARISSPTAKLANRKHKHRYILELLAGNPEARAAYLNLVMCLTVEGGIISTDDWSGKCCAPIIYLAEVISGARTDSAAAKVFLGCQLPYDKDANRTSSQDVDNIFRYPAANPKVHIRVGSIHSVKGETHTATLVMETFYRKHHLATLKPWLLSQKIGKGKEGIENVSRLKLLYVAMTRPSDLLCLAMREDAFTDSELSQLKRAPWRVGRITQTAVTWL